MRLLAAALLLFGCTSPQPPIVATVHGSTSKPAQQHPEAPKSAAASVDPATDVEPIDGCSASDAAALRTRLGHLSNRIEAVKDDAEARNLQAELAELWNERCLAHLARFFSPPSKLSAPALKRLWYPLGDTLLRSVGGLPRFQGKRYFLIPPEPIPDLPPDTRASLDRWICAPGDPSCDRSKSYIHRGNLAFEVSAERELAAANSYKSHTDECKKPPERWQGEGKPTPFEAWVACELSRAKRTIQYPELTFRAPEKGWLVIRGRRGHYTFTDEVRAYDLATGAAYVAQSGSALVLSGPGVDFAATDANRGLTKYTGRVAADQARELAFILITAAAPQTSRAKHGAIVPPHIPFVLGTDPIKLPTFGSSWGSSAQTTLSFHLVDGGAVLAEGEFTWPDSSHFAEDHADNLVRILEAGLVRGCAPAKLPRTLGRGAGATSPLDADPNRQATVFDELDAAILTLGRNTCPR